MKKHCISLNTYFFYTLSYRITCVKWSWYFYFFSLSKCTDHHRSIGSTGCPVSVNPTSGNLTLTRPLDYKNSSTYQLEVLAQDRGAKSLYATKRLDTATVDLQIKQVRQYSFFKLKMRKNYFSHHQFHWFIEQIIVLLKPLIPLALHWAMEINLVCWQVLLGWV